MASDSGTITVPPLLFVDNTDIMVNMENNQNVINRLLEVIKKLEARIEQLES